MLESQNTPTSEDSPVPPAGSEDSRPKSRDEQLEEISALLRGDDQDDQGEPKGDDQDGQPPKGEDPQKDGKLDTLEAIAKKLGLDVSALYDVAIPQPGSGEDRVTIGQLADLAKDKGRLELDRLEFDEARAKSEADLLRARQELNALVAMLPKRALSDELLGKVAEKMREAKQQARTATLEVISEWQDEATETADREEMTKHLAPYGFGDKYLDTITDARTIKYIRDNWQRQRNMERALAAMKQKRAEGSGRRGTPAKPGKGPGAEKPKPPAGPAGRQAQIEAVAEILRQSEG